MTNKLMLSVERDRIEDSARIVKNAGYHGLAEELRALLDKQPHARQEGYGQAMGKVVAVLEDQSCGACDGCANGCKLDRESPQVEPAAPHQGEAFTYSSKQETNCAGCGVRKHTPLRVDDMGGYVCLTCIDNRLGELLEAERHQGEPVAVMYSDGSVLTKPECGDSFEICCKVETPLYAEQPAPVAMALPFAGKVIAKLQRFEACASDGQDVDIGRHWFDLLTQLELLRRVQGSPAYWEMTQQGEDALEATRLNTPQ